MEGTVITMPAVALRGLTVFPAMMIHFDINRKRSVAAVEKAMVSDQKVFLVTQRQPEVVEPGLSDLYQVGTIALVKQMVKLPGGNIRVMVEGQDQQAIEASARRIAEMIDNRIIHPTL